MTELRTGEFVCSRCHDGVELKGDHRVYFYDGFVVLEECTFHDECPNAAKTGNYCDAHRLGFNDTTCRWITKEWIGEARTWINLETISQEVQ